MDNLGRKIAAGFAFVILGGVILGNTFSTAQVSNPGVTRNGAVTVGNYAVWANTTNQIKDGGAPVLNSIPANTVLGSITGGTPIALTKTQLTTLCNVATATLTGCAPILSNVATQFLNGTGAYSAPAYPVTSVFSRTGAVVAATNDYTFSQIGGNFTLAQGPTLSANRVLGSIAGGTPAELTPTQLTTLCNVATTLVTGCAPVLPNIATQFLNGTGAYSTPPGGFTGPGSSTDKTAVRFSGTGGNTGLASSLTIADTTAALSRVGAGGIAVQGTNTNDNAAAGDKGEYVESVLAAGSPVSLTANTAANITSISLTAGDWDVGCTSGTTYGATTTVAYLLTSISLTTATIDATNGRAVALIPASIVPSNYLGSGSAFGANVGPVRFSIAGTTTVYCVAQANFAVSTMGVYGILRARRVR